MTIIKIIKNVQSRERGITNTFIYDRSLIDVNDILYNVVNNLQTLIIKQLLNLALVLHKNYAG